MADYLPSDECEDTATWEYRAQRLRHPREDWKNERELEAA